MSERIDGRRKALGDSILKAARKDLRGSWVAPLSCQPGTVLVVIGLVATFVGGPEALSLFALSGVVSTNGQAITVPQLDVVSHRPRRTASGMQLPNRADAYAGGLHDSIDSNFTVCTDRIGVRVLVNRHHVGPLSRVVHSGLTRPDLTGRQK